MTSVIGLFVFLAVLFLALLNLGKLVMSDPDED